MSPKRAWIALLIFTLGFLGWFSARLAVTRVYQVDECQNLYMARVLATGQGSQFFTSASLFLIGPLSWLTEHAGHSVEIFTKARLLFLVLFWVNILLLALIVTKPLLSTRGIIALAAASTLAPLWDYGFEIRHDNVVLTGILLIWFLVRARPMGLTSYCLSGALTVALLFIAVKSLVYVVPLAAMTLAFPHPGHSQPRWNLALVWIGGALLGLVLVRLSFGNGGAWDQYLATFRGVSNYSASRAAALTRFWPWNALERLLVQTPLLLALVFSAGFALFGEFVRRGKSAISWDGMLPEFLLLLGVLAALFINPTPYPYNLVNVVPFAFLLAYKYAIRIWDEGLALRRSLWPLAATVVLVVHLIPFSVATSRHTEHPNLRQRELIRAAESLTDAGRDPVYDAIGMVPTRRSVHYRWYLHSLIMPWFNSPGHHVRDLLAEQPPAVVIPSYRTDWLPADDHEFLEQRYVPLADDFWVLGSALPRGGGSFEIYHPGRYCIVKMAPSKADPDHPYETNEGIAFENHDRVLGKLDGAAISNRPVFFATGVHHIETTDDTCPAVVWVGPRAEALPQLGPGDHQILFENWY